MGKKREIITLCISIGSFFLMSISFLLMPIDFAAKGMRVLDFLAGIVFWVFLLSGIGTQLVLGHLQRNWFIRNHIQKPQLNKRIGVISFIQNMPACIADGAFVAGLIGLIISIIATSGTGYLCYVFVALLVFSFCMHCIFNGSIYYFLVNSQEILNISHPGESDEIEKE